MLEGWKVVIKGEAAAASEEERADWVSSLLGSYGWDQYCRELVQRVAAGEE